MEYYDLIEDIFRSSVTHIETALSACRTPLAAALRKSSSIIEHGGTLYFAGNGGSAADASHAASELVGAFENYTAPLPAISLSSDISLITSVGNDFSFEKIFLQQVRALVKRNDLLWLISTSGNSMNLFHAAAWARENKVSTVGLLGRKGGRLATQVDYPLIVPGDNTQRIQEVHTIILHILASALKRAFPDGIVHNVRSAEKLNPGKAPQLDSESEEELNSIE